jgi:hypothetical protein
MQHGVFTYYLLQAATKGYHVLGLFSDRLLSGRCITILAPSFRRYTRPRAVCGMSATRGEAMKRIEGFAAAIRLQGRPLAEVLRLYKVRKAAITARM